MSLAGPEDDPEGDRLADMDAPVLLGAPPDDLEGSFLALAVESPSRYLLLLRSLWSWPLLVPSDDMLTSCRLQVIPGADRVRVNGMEVRGRQLASVQMDHWSES